MVAASGPTSSSFDRKPTAEKPWTESLWIYDLRTNKHFTLKETFAKAQRLGRLCRLLQSQEPPRTKRIRALQELHLRRANQARPVTQRHARPGFPPKSRHVDSFAPAQSVSRPARLSRSLPAARLWLKDESLEDSANLPDPDIIAVEIVEDLEAAVSQFATIAADLKR